MATNSILQIAASATDVLSQSEYEALSDLATGLPTGIVSRRKLNKILKQVSLVARAVAEVVVSEGTSVDDTITPSALSNLIKAAIRSGVGSATDLENSLASSSAGTSKVFGAVRYAASLAELRALPKTGTPVALVDGYGVWRFVPGDTATADNGVTRVTATDGGRWALVSGDIGPVLTATEGVTFASGYRSVTSGHLDVPVSNTTNTRYWTANFTLRIPAGATIPANDVRHDHAALSARSWTEALNSRVWGGVMLVHNTSAATSNEQAGQGLACELDVNWSPSTGYNLNNLAGDGDVGALLIASGSTSIPKFAQCLSKLGNPAIKGFYVGRWVREQSIDPTGFVDYIGNVAPSWGYYFAPDYTGGPALSTPSGLDALWMRTTSGPSARIRSNADRMELNCGNGGYQYANANNDTVLMTLSNAGALGLGTAPGSERIKSQPANTSSSRALMLMTGGGDVGAYSSLGNVPSTSGESGTDAMLYVRKASNGRSLNLAGTLNAAGADYAEYMVRDADCGIVLPGSVAGVTPEGTLTDVFDRAVSFVVKSTNPCLVGGDTWSAHLKPPIPPVFVPHLYTGVSAPGAAPQVTARMPKALKKDASSEEVQAYDTALRLYEDDVARVHEREHAWREHVEQWEADQGAAARAHRDAAAHFETVDMRSYQESMLVYQAELEVARARVDRIAFCGQAPVLGVVANPGDYLVPLRTSGGGITVAPVPAASLSLSQYLSSVGVVQNSTPTGVLIRVRVA